MRGFLISVCNLSDSFHITGTAFNSKDTTWTQPWGENKSIRNHFNEMAVHLGNTKNTPMTFKTRQGVYASIHEAALTDFPEMTLKQTHGCNFKSELASWPDGVKARFAGEKFQTPWRTIQITPKAVGLTNSGLILDLNEPCRYADGADADLETNPTSYQISEKTVTATDSLKIVMAKGGGQAITLIPENSQ